MIDQLSNTPTRCALRVALKHMVCGYNAHCLPCAAELGSKSITEDATLRKAAPGLTRSLQDTFCAYP